MGEKGTHVGCGPAPVARVVRMKPQQRPTSSACARTPAAGRIALAVCALLAMAAASGAGSRAIPGWTHEAAAKPVPALYPGFGSSVAANDVGLVAMSSARDHDIGVDASAVAVAALRRGRFEPAGLVRHPQHRHDAGFGMSLAIDDDSTLYVGAPELGAGAVFIFERPEWARDAADGLWQPVAELRSPNPQQAARFGASIAVWGRGQGRRIVVGEPDRDMRSHPGIDGFRAGAVHIFERTGTTWGHACTLTSPSPGTTARFGSSVAIHGDTVVIGEPGASRRVRSSTLWSCGTAWTAHRVDGQWSVQQQLHPPKPHALAAFGSCVGLDGVTVAVAALREPIRASAPGSGPPRRGIVHLYECAGSGWPTDPSSRLAPWRPVQRILPPTPDDEHFAASLSIRDGVIAIGAPAATALARAQDDWSGAASVPDDDEEGRDWPRRTRGTPIRDPVCGAAYVYEKVHANTWVPRARCVAPNPADGWRDGVGVSLARRSDGCIGVVMSRGGDPEGPPGPGAMNAFTPLTMAVSAIPTRWLAGMG